MPPRWVLPTVLVLATAGCAGPASDAVGTNTTADALTTTTAAPSTTTTEASADESYALGEPIEAAGFRLVVTATYEPWELPRPPSCDDPENVPEFVCFVTPSEGSRFVGVDLEVTNTSDEVQHFVPVFLSVKDRAGHSWGLSSAPDLADLPTFDGGNIDPGSTRTGLLVFEVPADQTGLLLVWEPDPFSGPFVVPFQT